MVKGKIAKCETVENKKGTDKISIYLAEGAEQAMRWKKEGKEIEITEKKDEGEIEQRESNLDGVYRGLAAIMEIIAELIVKEKNKAKEKPLIFEKGSYVVKDYINPTDESTKKEDLL